MKIDYQKLCIDLFGTDDVETLTDIANRVKAKNDRNAGRKKKFVVRDIKEMKTLLQNGMTINEIAQRFDTSRQIISKYLNERPGKDYTLRMTYMYKQFPCTLIDVNFLDRDIRILNKTNDMLRRAFGTIENPGWADFEAFLQERCFPATRGNAKELLKQLGVTDYDPIQIVEKTRGRTAEDDMWLKFNYYPRKGAANG